MLEISNNSTSIMRSCQKKYYWNYIEGLKPIKKSNVLAMGSIIHEAFQKFYASSASTATILSFITDTLDLQISTAQPEKIEDLTITKYTLQGMWKACPFKIQDFKSIEPEKEFRIKVPGTRGIVFVGKVDGLVCDLQGAMWVRELKTTAQPFSLFEVRSRQSSQGTGYIWAMRKLGYPVVGVMYDYIKKPLLRKGINETADEFGTRIFNDYLNRPDVYFKRHPSYRTDEELKLYEADLRQVAYDIRARVRDHGWHRNTEQCWIYNSECPFLKICFKDKVDPLLLQTYYTQQPTSFKGADNAEQRRDGGSAPASTGGSGSGSGEGRGEDSIAIGPGEDL